MDLDKLLIDLDSPEKIAKKFGLTYKELSKLIYSSTSRSYKTFTIPKKNGGVRVIHAPKIKLLTIQRTLAEEFSEIYNPKLSSHGFIPGRSIVTNAERHTRKRFVFNVDLKDFFGSIHFGRVRNLLMSKPLSYSYTSATILAQICCHNNELPQGAPTSPVISNMICWRLDAILQTLASKNNCTYSRYADDMTFSFSTSKNYLPRSIVNFDETGAAVVGDTLLKVIEENGFTVNTQKVRLKGRSQRQEVTGITVNDKLNVDRGFIRKTNSMLHAWMKFGLEAAEDAYLTKYHIGYLSDWQREKSKHSKGDFFKNVVKGRINYIQMVKGRQDPVYRKLAYKLTIALGKPNEDFRKSMSEIASNSTFVIYNHVTDQQGTGFLLEGVGIVTNEHVAEMIDETNEDCIDFYLHDEIGKKLHPLAIFKNKKLDIAIFQPTPDFKPIQPLKAGNDSKIQYQSQVTVIGYPSFTPGSSPYINTGQVIQTREVFDQSVKVVNVPINHGCSGGPILDERGDVVGIATYGAEKHTGNNDFNGFLPISSVFEIVNSSEFIKSKLKRYEIDVPGDSEIIIDSQNAYCRNCLTNHNTLTIAAKTKSENIYNCKICMKTIKG